MVFARKPDGSWRICYDYRGFNAITLPAVEQLQHIDALLDGTRGSLFFTKLALASSYHQLRVRATDRWKTSFRLQLGQFEWNNWNMVQFGLQGSSALMRIMNQELTVGLDLQGGLTTTTVTAETLHTPPGRPRPALTPIHGGSPGLRAHWACAR